MCDFVVLQQSFKIHERQGGTDLYCSCCIMEHLAVHLLQTSPWPSGQALMASAFLHLKKGELGEDFVLPRYSHREYSMDCGCSWLW